MQTETRLTLGMSFPEIVSAMADGNPGAMGAIFSMANFKGDIDNMLGGLAPILTMDSNKIYGSSIYILFNDICGRDAAKACAVLRAVQLGEFSGHVLFEACLRQDYSGSELVPVEDLYNRVIEALPNFDLERRIIVESVN